MAVLIRFFDGCVISVSAENGVVAVQLKVGVAIALDLDGCRAGVIPTGLRLNVHILQGHIGGLIFCRIHCDGIFGLFAVAGDGDAGIVLVIVYLCVLLRHIGDAVLFGLYRHTALVQIVSVRKGCCGDGRDHGHQSRCGQHPQGKLLFHIFPHCKNPPNKKTCRDVNVTGNDAENRQKPELQGRKTHSCAFSCPASLCGTSIVLCRGECQDKMLNFRGGG